MYETGAPPPPLPDSVLVIDHAANMLPPPIRQAAPLSAVKQYDSPAAVLPAGPPPGTVTYRLRGTETAQDG